MVLRTHQFSALDRLTITEESLYIAIGDVMLVGFKRHQKIAIVRKMPKIPDLI